ncbi:MAG: hypothetical protein A3B08_00130 [Candidatus Taylorbacteria bacterium RIFCSPLOWO2_01_FULL_43_44]|nr:MAG: hypothetical protein A3B08_00130 [Candidatus Taylorbacteria bacterium RIFCSPLOWO2_01_FULL_43_44]
METQKQSNIPLPVAIMVAGVMISTAIFINGRVDNSVRTSVSADTESVLEFSAEEETVLPSVGVELPVVWGDLGQKLVSVGAIDRKKFDDLYRERGNFGKGFDELLNGKAESRLKINRENAGYLLNLLWALGLSSKNPVLDEGDMRNPRYGGAERFASTAGWTLALGNPMDHYSAHKFFSLTAEQQALVVKVAKNIYRPCCNNSTYFPDCNHGMAMLGLLQLMASQGVGEREMYKTALAVNSYWFPETYITIASYMKAKGIEWKDVDPKDVLGSDYSSASGYARVSAEAPIRGRQIGGGSGCSVGEGAPASNGGVGCSI